MAFQSDLYNKMAEAWYSSYKIGKIKKQFYELLQRRYQFDKWHITPINFRPYAIGIVRYLNKKPKKKVVEVGCGLGEIIGNISGCEREAYDIDVNVIRAAKKLYRKTNFKVGTFDSIKNQRIDYLITVNFIHGIPPAELKDNYEWLLKSNDISHLIFDIVDSPEYKYKHEPDYLFEGVKSDYRVRKLLRRCAALGGSRRIYILEKQDIVK